MGQIELFDIKTVYLSQTELLEIESFEHLTVCKQITYVYLIGLVWFVWFYGINNLCRLFNAKSIFM